MTLFTDVDQCNRRHQLCKAIKEQEGGYTERCPILQHTQITLYPRGKKKEPSSSLQKCFKLEGQKSKTRKTFLLAAVLENYIPKDVHIFFHFTNERRSILPKPQKPFKGFINSIVNSGKEAGTE